MRGRIDNVVVSWITETSDGPRSRAIDLESFRRHCRRERVEDLLDDLQLLCEDVLARRNPEDSGRPGLAVIRGIT